MWFPPLFWIAVSLTAFWALGAYNRLMRLRTAVVQAFGGLDAHMLRLLALLGEVAAARASDRSLDRTRDVPTAAASAGDRMAALEGAAVQFSASLAVARARPLHADALAALVSARSVLEACWAAAMDDKVGLPGQIVAAPAEAAGGAGHGSAEVADASGARPVDKSAAIYAVQPLQIRWSENMTHANHAIEAFNEAVRQYNEAVAQFPASVLARLFGFKAARGL